VLFFRRFNDVELSDVTVRFGAYGWYPRDVRKCVVRNVRFVNLGSDGTTNRHDFSGSQAEQAAFWAGNSTSDGGACRIRSAGVVEVTNCQVDYCLRGLRIQDCGSTDQASIVANCRVYRCSEAGIYLAAGTYNGASGCNNFMVSSNTVFECYNNGLLCIGGQGNTFQGNNVVRSANAGFQGYSVLDTRCIGNSFYDCNSKDYNGIGNLGDAYGCIVLAGGANSAIGTGSHAGVLQNNTMVKCNQGRAAAIYGIHIQVAAGTYPTASDKVILDANNSDATVRVHNPNSIPEIATQAAASGGATTVVQMTDVSSAGSGAIITTVERALITTNQTNIASKQDALTFGVVTDTGATVLSENIKLYVDANSGGSSLTTLTITTTGGSGTNKSAWPVIANHTKINLSGGVIRYRCPNSPSEGDELHIRWTADTHASSLILGTVGNTFDYWSEGGTRQSSTQMSIENPHVKAKVVVRFEHGEWTVTLRTHSGAGRYHKSFSHTATHKSGNPFQLPSGYMDYSVILGDNSDYVSAGTPAFNAQTFGCYVRLPFFVKDGCKCHFETHLDKNSSSATEVIVVQADLFAGRKMRDEFGTLHTANPSYKNITSNIYNTRSWTFTWNALYQTWIVHQEVN